MIGTNLTVYYKLPKALVSLSFIILIKALSVCIFEINNYYYIYSNALNFSRFADTSGVKGLVFNYSSVISQIIAARYSSLSYLLN